MSMSPLRPIAEAFQAAAAEDARLAAEAEARAQDRAYLVDALKRNGEGMFRKVASAMGFSEAEMSQIIAEVEAARRPKARPEPEARGKKKHGEDAAPPPGGEAGPEGEGDAEGPRWVKAKAPIKPLPDDCPVEPMGMGADLTCHYLTPGKRLVALEAGKHAAANLRGLFGARQDFLWGTWPKYNERSGLQTGWKADQAAESLIDACARKGDFDEFDRRRGLGGWGDGQGGLVLHCGDGVLVNGEWREPGMIGRHVYEALEAVRRPGDTDGVSEMRRFLADLDTWNWIGRENDDADSAALPARVEGIDGLLPSRLLLGWSMAARAGAALAYRPIVWLTGDAGSGKSTLIELLSAVQERNLISVSNPTAAGIWQTLGASTRAVAIDEAEPDPESNRVRALVELARQATTGGMILRGSNTNKSTAFEAKSAFLFGSILIPPQLPQDVSRTSVLELGPIEGGRIRDPDPAKTSAISAALGARLTRGWHRWRETYAEYQAALAKAGHNARGCNQWGTLLAMADLALGDERLDSDSIEILAGAFSRERTDRAQYVSSNAHGMLAHLITWAVDAFRGGNRVTIGALVAKAAGLDEHATGGGDAEGSPRGALDALAAVGVHVQGFKDAARVTLPNQSAGLLRVFHGSQWHGVPGAAGGWAQAMRRLPGHRAENSRALGGRGWSVPASVFLMREGG